MLYILYIFPKKPDLISTFFPVIPIYNISEIYGDNIHFILFQFLQKSYDKNQQYFTAGRFESF